MVPHLYPLELHTIHHRFLWTYRYRWLAWIHRTARRIWCVLYLNGFPVQSWLYLPNKVATVYTSPLNLVWTRHGSSFPVSGYRVGIRLLMVAHSITCSRYCLTLTTWIYSCYSAIKGEVTTHSRANTSRITWYMFGHETQL